MSIGRTDLFKIKIVVLIAFMGISFIIFSSSTSRIFLSDDYCTLHNIISHDSILIPSFFRVVGDLTLKWTYDVVGWEPFYFYVINILLHAINSFLVYIFCRKWFKDEARVHLYSLAAGLIFLTYPSHSEAILWAIGRGISLAVFFSLLAMIVFISDAGKICKYIFVCLFYFIALACYENAMLLPFVLFALPGGNFRRTKMVWPVLLLLTLVLHIFMRYYYIGGIWQTFYGDIYSHDLVQHLSSFVKMTVRLFVPPFDDPLLFSLCGIAVLVSLFVIYRRCRGKIGNDSFFIKTVTLCFIGLLATILIGISFGVSTRTSEGDRLLYFPSVFYAIFLSLLIVRLTPGIRSMTIITVMLLIFQVCFLLVNQQHWIRASEDAVKIIDGIRAHRERPLSVINLPSDYKGAYIFRNCLSQALLHYNIDTAGVKIINVIQSTQIEKKAGVIAPELQGNQLFIWPNTLLEMSNGFVLSVNGDTTVKKSELVNSFLYWNKEELVPIARYLNSR